jgi:hypothetical protein
MRADQPQLQSVLILLSIPLIRDYMAAHSDETAKKSGPTPQHGTLDTNSGTLPRIRYSGPSFEPAVADGLLSASIAFVVFSPFSC